MHISQAILLALNPIRRWELGNLQLINIIRTKDIVRGGGIHKVLSGEVRTIFADLHILQRLEFGLGGMGLNTPECTQF